MFGYAVIRCVAKETVLLFPNKSDDHTTLHYTEHCMELQISKGKKKINLRMYLFLVSCD